MRNRMALAIAALLVFVIGVPVAYLVAWGAPLLSVNTEFLLLVSPALISLMLAGIAVIPGRSSLGTKWSDWIGVIVGSVSLLAVAVGTAIVALTAAM